MEFKRLRGTHDILDQDAVLFADIESAARRVFARFDFQEIRTPILESRDLFKRALGTDTDVVQKEMYEFEDRSKEWVAMRPEGTAGVVRAYLENNLDKTQGLAKLFYMGAMFRSERPQAGRQRQFHQIGVEALGAASPYSDAEVILCLTSLLDELGASGYELKLNNIGTFEERDHFRLVLKEYFKPLLDVMCSDCQNRYDRNVFRLLDCKVPKCRDIARNSPLIATSLSQDSRNHFDMVCRLLEASGVKYTLDNHMVRGLDYYTKTVFEVTHSALGSQDAIGAGGRYDRLIEAFDGPKVGAVGYAVGVERICMVIKALRAEKNQTEEKKYLPCVFLAALGETAQVKCFEIMSRLRFNGVAAATEFGGKSLKSQMRAADKSQSRFVLIVGDDELAKGKANLRNMQNATQEEIILNDQLTEVLKGKLSC